MEEFWGFFLHLCVPTKQISTESLDVPEQFDLMIH